MKKLIFCALAAISMTAAGCATVESSADAMPDRMNRDDKVTGSRLPRSEAAENYQGAKSMTRKDYEEYKNATSLKGGT